MLRRQLSPRLPREVTGITAMTARQATMPRISATALLTKASSSGLKTLPTPISATVQPPSAMPAQA